MYEEKGNMGMSEEKILLSPFLEGNIPSVSGMIVEMKKSSKKDDECLYFKLPLERDKEFYAVNWGQGRRTVALYTEAEFEKLKNSLVNVCRGEGVGRRYARMLMLSSHFSCYEKKLGFYIRPILLDEKLKQWEYIENPEKKLTCGGFDGEQACPFAFITGK